MATTYIVQANRKRGVAYRKFPYSKKKGSAYHWKYVLRAKDKRRRELIARGAEYEAICKKIKYSNEKNSNARLYDDVKPYKFNCLKLKKKSYTNCCNGASVACRYAGIKTPRKSSARTLPSTWKKTGAFYIGKYKGHKHLKRGDTVDANEKPKVHTATYIGRKRGRKK